MTSIEATHTATTPSVTTPSATPSNDPLDRALARLRQTGFEYFGSLSNHGPMVAEAMHHGGRESDIDSWVERYLMVLDPAAEPTGDSTVPPALGITDAPTAAAWFEHELGRRPWQDVVSEWVPRLTPGSIGAAGHGLLRAAHALRGLTDADRRERRDELALGLAYWVENFTRTPGAAPTGALSAEAALLRLPTTAIADIPSISAKVLRIDRSTFDPASAEAGFPSELDAGFAQIAELALRALAANPEASIALIHAVTTTVALQSLQSFVDAKERSQLRDQAWCIVASLWSVYGERPPVAREQANGATPPTWDELLDAAIVGSDEHDIKLTVAAKEATTWGVDDVVVRTCVAAIVRGAR